MNNGEKKAGFYVLLLLVGIIIGGVVVYLFLGSKDTAPVSVATDSAKSEKKIKYWQAPMDPTYIRDEPGKSPMGMDLVPVYEGDGEEMEPGTVKIDPVMTQNIGVRTVKVGKKRLTNTIRSAGRVDYDEKRVHHVNTKIEGWVEKLYVDFTGQEVKKDDYLLEIYSPKLVATQEEYLLARRYADSSRDKDGVAGIGDRASVLELSKKRLELWDVPAHQIRELEESGEIKKTIHVHSPASGIVVNKKVQEGMFIKPGVNLYTIADLSKVWVYADLYEYEFAWVKEGQEAEMTLAAYPGETFKGKVAFINPFMEPKTRTVKVRLEFDNPDGKLKPDMFANVVFISKMERAGIAVPTEAVLLSGERSVVIVSRGEGKFTPREVTLGAQAGGFYEVIDGLAEGEEIVTSAHFLIDSESRLSEAISKMLELKSDKDDVAEPEKMKHEPVEHEPVEHEPVDHEGMDHSKMKHEPVKHEEMDHSGMDHGSMNHNETEEKMDHSGMDHSKMKHEPVKHEKMEHEPVDHSGMDHGKTKDEEMDHSGMDHGSMNHNETEEKMDHSGMDHSNMEHEPVNHEGMDHD